MSDDEYYSETEDNVSETNSEDGDPTDISIIKPPVMSGGDDSEPDDADVESDEDEFIPDEEDEDNLIESDDDIESEEDEKEDEDEDEDENIIITKKKVSEKKSKKQKQLMVIDYEEEEDEEYNDNYLEKFDSELVKNYINDFHPECLSHNYDEISKLSVVVRNSDGIIIDPLHRTIPYLTKYERARILGQRSKQIETGSRPFVKVPENIVDGYIIAELELKEKKLPFIIKRPIPGGGCEYWNLNDLEVIAF